MTSDSASPPDGGEKPEKIVYVRCITEDGEEVLLPTLKSLWRGVASVPEALLSESESHGIPKPAVIPTVPTDNTFFKK